jgi:arylsulfatase A
MIMTHRLLLVIGITLCCAARSTAEAAPPSRPPNFIVILCDNLGYGDLGCFGSKLHRTPNIDRLAAEGMRLTHFYVSSGVCTPSRASLMTGCYPRRVNLHESDTGGLVLQPVSSKGLHPDEVTIAEILKKAGYATACIGKWHLGDQVCFLPTRQGFDSYFGIPYSDDMTSREGKNWPPLPLMRNEKVIEAPVERTLLTRRYTEEAIRFIQAQRDKPFFLYLPHAMPGSTAAPFSSEAFRGKSANGPYGDAVEELDWSTGQIVAELKKLQLEDNTFIVWTSDNGAVQQKPLQGSNGPLGGWGYTTAEGGMRVPCLVRWPGKVPAQMTCAELTTSMDLLPTFARLAGARPPGDRVIDGKDIWPLLTGERGAKSPHEAFYYYHKGALQAVRSGQWKLNLTPARLFDVVANPGETDNVVADHPQVIERLRALAEKAREDLGDGQRAGKNQRPAGHEPMPTPRVLEAK